jgi:hypothetical protein
MLGEGFLGMTRLKGNLSAIERLSDPVGHEGMTEGIFRQIQLCLPSQLSNAIDGNAFTDRASSDAVR